MFNQQQIEFLIAIGMNFDFNNLSNSNLIEIENAVGEKLATSGLDENYNPNEIGKICESILDKF